MKTQEAAKHYQFTITVAGFGKNPQEAWEDTLEGLFSDPGGVPEEFEIIEEDE